MATQEKALVDTVAVLSSRGGKLTLTEIEFPVSFSTDEVKKLSTTRVSQGPCCKKDLSDVLRSFTELILTSVMRRPITSG
jgi:hypothetical protein